MSVKELERIGQVGGPSLLGKSPMRGRDAERERISAWVGLLAAGAQVPLLVIEGSPGMGKSRLLDELRGQAQMRSLNVITAACDAVERDRPFASLMRAFGCFRRSIDPTRRLLAERCRDLFANDDHSVVDSLDGRRFGVQDDLVELLAEASETVGQILIVDDAQWLDPFSAAAIGAMVRVALRRRIGVVLARRLHPCPRDLEAILVAQAARTEVIELGPLADDAVAAITQDTVGHPPPFPLPPRLAQAGGSPFAVLAVLSSTWMEGETASESTATLRIARASTMARIRALGDDVAEVLQWACVLGVAFTPDQVGMLSGQSPVAAVRLLSLATADGVLRAVGSSFEFSHDLVAEFVRDSIPDPMRLAMHREVARLAKGLRLRPTMRAHHLLVAAEAGDVEAIAALTEAADAIARHDPQQAINILDRAEQLSEGIIAPQIEIALRRADALSRLCRVQDAIDVVDSALLIAESADDVVRLRSTRARCRHQIGDILGAADECELLARSRALDTALEAAAWADVATYRLWGMQGARPFDAAHRAIELAQASDVVAPYVQAQAVLGAMAAFDGDITEAIHHADLAQQRGLALAPHVVVPSPAFVAGLVRLLADDVDESVRILLADQVRIERVGDPLMAARPATAAVIAMFLNGRWDDALVETKALTQLADETGLSIGRLTSQVIGGLIAHHRGDDAAADAALIEATTTEGPSEAYAVPFLLQLQAARAEAGGDVAAAAKIISDLAALSNLIAPAIGPWFALDLIRLTIDSHGASRNPRCAPGSAAADATCSSVEPQPLDDSTMTSVLAGLAHAARSLADRSDRALAHAIWHLADALIDHDPNGLRRSLEYFRRTPLLLHRIAGMELAGIALLKAGCTSEGRGLLDEALVIAQSLGAERYVERINGTLHGHGQRPAKRTRRPSFGFESLTPAELSVLGLLIDGSRNRDIADTLVISKRTVESHVSSMMMKLGVETRVALARVGSDHLARLR